MPFKSKKSGKIRGMAGELFVDNREAPVGLPQKLEGVQGLIPAGAVRTFQTGTCAHCNKTVVFNPDRVRPRAHCSRCNYYICDGCEKVGFCTFIEDLADLAMARPGTPVLTPGGFDLKLLEERRIH